MTITFSNHSIYGDGYLWEFGDGATSSSFEPTHTYQFAGTYNVKLTVTGPGGETDTKEVMAAVSVQSQPTANFVYSPSEVPVPSPVTFINYSLFADSYLWNFGDSTESTEDNPQKKLFAWWRILSHLNCIYRIRMYRYISVHRTHRTHCGAGGWSNSNSERIHT